MAKIFIDFKFPDFAEKLKSREEELLLFVAAQLQTNRAMMFDTENAGRTKWEPLKLRQGQTLSQSGALRKSFAPQNDGRKPVQAPNGIVRFTGDTVTIGTTLAYAPIHNTGGVIRPKRYPVLWIPLPNGRANSSMAPSKLTKSMIKGHKEGKKGGAPIVRGRNGKFYLLAKQAKIPRRPMDEWNPADQAELEGALKVKLEEILNG